MLNRMFAQLALVLALLVPAAAFADDWVATKLRGQVLQLIDNQWVAIARGDVVPDDRVIRTGPNGRVDFRRDEETISLAADTQIQIYDRVGERFTTVQQHFGTVEIEAEVRNVRHFAVETPLLAAVVKGTRFVVRSGKSEASVQVKRGRVEVTDKTTGAHALVPSGQTATVAVDGSFALDGRGAQSTQIIGATGMVVGAGSVSGSSATGSVGGVGVEASVGGTGVGVGVTTPVGEVQTGVVVGPDAVGVDVEVGDVVDVDVDVGTGGIGVGADVGDTGVSVGVGGSGGGVSVGVGGVKLKLF
ncbi:MAG: FecR domain-containing protein [Devosia sp.]